MRYFILCTVVFLVSACSGDALTGPSTLAPHDAAVTTFVPRAPTSCISLPGTIADSLVIIAHTGVVGKPLGIDPITGRPIMPGTPPARCTPPRRMPLPFFLDH
jgi:hypothetical protein